MNKKGLFEILIGVSVVPLIFLSLWGYDKYKEMKHERNFEKHTLIADKALEGYQEQISAAYKQFPFFDQTHRKQAAMNPAALAPEDRQALDSLHSIRKSSLPFVSEAALTTPPKPDTNAFLVVVPLLQLDDFHRLLDERCGEMVMDRIKTGKWNKPDITFSPEPALDCLKRYGSYRFSIVYEELFYKPAVSNFGSLYPGETFGKVYLYEIGKNTPLGYCYAGARSSENVYTVYVEGEDKNAADAKSLRLDLLKNIQKTMRTELVFTGRR